MPTREDLNTGLERLAEFSANKLSPIFGLFRWTWYSGGSTSSPDKIPTCNDIEQQIMRLLSNLVENDYDWTGTGRITVQKRPDDGLDIYSVFLDIGEFAIERETPNPNTEWAEEGF